MVYTEETAQKLAKLIQGREGKTERDAKVFAYEILDFLVEHGEFC